MRWEYFGKEKHKYKMPACNEQFAASGATESSSLKQKWKWNTKYEVLCIIL